MQSLNYQRLLKGCMWLAVAIGAYSRFRGLGIWPLAVDEYFISHSVDNILQHGVPAFGCGGFYMRGLTLQYLIVPLRELGLSAELAGRLVTVACSFAVLPAVYFLGKRLSGVTVACVSVALLSLSLWEIEFARYIRMYSPFQAIFVWYLLALHRVVVDRKSSAYGWLWLLSLAGVFTWEGGLFLLVINFVPGLIEGTPSRPRHWIVSAGLLLLGYLYSAVDFRFMGPQPAFPPDVPIQLGGSHFVMPPVLASTLSTYPTWIIGALALLLVSMGAVVKLARSSAAPRERLAWIGLVALSLLNLFGCVLIGLLLALLLGWIDIRRASRRCLLVAAVPVAASFVFWLSYALFTDGGHQLFPSFGPGGELSKLAVLLFKYPNVFDSILFQWYGAIPVLTAIFGGLIALAVVWVLWAGKDKHSTSLRLILVVCLLMAALVGVIDTKFLKTRYTFFLLPALYLIAVTTFHTLFVRPLRSRPARGTALGLALVALVAGTEDFGWAHMMHIDRMAWNYRLRLDWPLTVHFYPRRDYLTSSEFVNLRARPKDVIIITRLTSDHYLKRTDYVYRSFRNGEFASIACDAGRRERWTGSRLLYREQDLFNVIAAAPATVWLIVRLPQSESLMEDLAQQYGATPVYRGFEGQMTVYKINHSR